MKNRIFLIALSVLIFCVSCTVSSYPRVIYIDMSDTATALVYNERQAVLYCAELPMEKILASKGDSSVRKKIRHFCGLDEDIYCESLARDGRAAMEMLGDLSKTGVADNINSLLKTNISGLAKRMKQDSAQVVYVDGQSALDYFSYWMSQLYGGQA